MTPTNRAMTVTNTPTKITARTDTSAVERESRQARLSGGAQSIRTLRRLRYFAAARVRSDWLLEGSGFEPFFLAGKPPRIVPRVFLFRKAIWKFVKLNRYAARTFIDPEWYLETCSIVRNFSFSTEVAVQHAFPPRLTLAGGVCSRAGVGTNLSRYCRYRELKPEHIDDGAHPGSESTRYYQPFAGVGKAERSCSTINGCGPDCSRRRSSSRGDASLPLRTPPCDRGIPDELSRSVARHDRFATASVARSDGHGFPSRERVGHTPDRMSHRGRESDAVVLGPKGNASVT